MREPNNLYLVGFMGCGKSTVGTLLGRLLGRVVVDTDRTIEQDVGKSISHIFSHQGEGDFRRLERKAISNTIGQTNLIVALGGGAFIDEENRRSILESGFAIYLNASLSTLLPRICESERPLFHREGISDLFQSRDPIYRLSSLIVETDYKTLEQIALEVMEGTWKLSS